MCQFVSLVVTVFNFVMAIFPLLGLGTLFYGAVMWATASSEPQKLEQAKKTLTYGVIGFILGLSSIVILLTVENMFLKPGGGFSLSNAGSLRVNFCIDPYFADPCSSTPCDKISSGSGGYYGTNCKRTYINEDDSGNPIYDGGFICCGGTASSSPVNQDTDIYKICNGTTDAPLKAQ